MKSSIRKNDLVKVISGASRGKNAKVLWVDRDLGKVLLEGTNLRKKHVRPNQQNQKGGIIDIEVPLSVSNVMLVCPKCSKAGRVRHKTMETGKTVRTCRKCGEIVDKV
jgi:large subunit ribosomal protein L24